MKIIITAGATLDVRPGVALSFRNGVIVIELSTSDGVDVEPPEDPNVTIAGRILAAMKETGRQYEWHTFIEILKLAYPKEVALMNNKADPLYNKVYTTVGRMVGSGHLEFEKPFGRRQGRYRVALIQP